MSKKKWLIVVPLGILIGFGIILILWAFAFSSWGSHEPPKRPCYDAEVALTIVKNSETCYSSNFSQVKVRREVGDFELAGIEVNWYSKDDVLFTEIFSGEDLPLENGYAVLKSLFDSSLLRKVTIAPIRRIGNTEAVCSETIPVDLQPCE